MKLHCPLLVTLISLSAALPAIAEEGFRPLLDDDLSAWRVPEDNRWWTLEEGVLTAKSDPDLRGTILWTKQPFRDFEVRLEFLFAGGRVDTGVFLRAKREQIQIGESISLGRDLTGAPYIAGKGYPVEGLGVAADKLTKQDDWNQLDIRAVGNLYTVHLNGKQVLEYASITAEEEGPIGLQLHANREMTVRFRGVEVKELGE